MVFLCYCSHVWAVSGWNVIEFLSSFVLTFVRFPLPKQMMTFWAKTFTVSGNSVFSFRMIFILVRVRVSQTACDCRMYSCRNLSLNYLVENQSWDSTKQEPKKPGILQSSAISTSLPWIRQILLTLNNISKHTFIHYLFLLPNTIVPVERGTDDDY